MAHLHFQAHGFQRQHDGIAHALRLVAGREVEVTADIVRHGLRQSIVGRTQQEKFQLGSHVELEPHVFGVRQLPLKNVARIAIKRCAVGVVNVADHAGTAAFRRTPRQNLVGAGIQVQLHVAFLNAREPFHRRAVEPHALLQRARHAVHGQIHTLHRAQQIGELQRQELHAVGLNSFHQILILHDVVSVKK